MVDHTDILRAMVANKSPLIRRYGGPKSGTWFVRGAMDVNANDVVCMEADGLVRFEAQGIRVITKKGRDAALRAVLRATEHVAADGATEAAAPAEAAIAAVSEAAPAIAPEPLPEPGRFAHLATASGRVPVSAVIVDIVGRVMDETPALASDDDAARDRALEAIALEASRLRAVVAAAIATVSRERAAARRADERARA